jgi:PAS domain S-box-containing protein
MLHLGKETAQLIRPIRFRIFSLFCGKAALLTGVVVLTGWWRGLTFLTSVVPGLATMKPITAVAFSMTGISLWLYHGAQGGSRGKRTVCRWLSRASAGIVVWLGCATLAEYIAGMNSGMDELLFQAALNATHIVNPGRMSPATAVGFLLIGLAQLCLHGEAGNWRTGSQVLALTAGLVGFVGSLAYLYGVPLLGGPEFYSSMALHTSLLLTMLGLGVLFARPDSGLTAEITGNEFGGLMARRLLPLVIVLPIALGSAWQYGWRGGFYSAEFASALTDITAVVLLCLLVWQSAKRLNRLDQQRRQAEERDSWLAAIVNSSNDAIIGRTVEGTINSWNAAAERLFGYREEEVLGMPPNPFIPEDRAEEVRESLAAGRQGRTIERYETVRTRKDGSTVDVSQTQSPVIDSDGRIMGYAILLQDITEQKRNQALLRESQSQLHAVVHSAMDAVIIVDSRQEIILFNTAAEKMFGYAAAEIRGQLLSRLIPEPYRAAHTEHLRRFGQAGITSRTMGALNTVHGQRANGEIFPIEASISQFESAGRKLFSAIVRDLSERRQTEDALRLTQAQLLSALEAGSMGTWSWDIPHDAVAWTDPLLRVHELARESVCDDRLKTFLSFVHAGDRPAVEKALWTAAQDGAAYEVEYRVRRPDGALQWIAARGRLERDARAQPSRLTGVCMDITARKRLEETLLQSHKMEALGTLAGGVAHDFNNILMSIGGNVELAMAELLPDHPAHQNLVRIEKASGRAADLVRQILTFSRHQPPARVVIPLEHEVEEAVKLLRATLPARIEIRAEYLPGVPSVSADPTQLHQILMNLGANAAHAMGESSGLIELRLEGVDISGDQSEVAAGLSPGRYARLTFRDNGCGMDKTTLARAFEPFFTTKEVGKGTGLGLSVVHGIMKNHGGAVIVYSEVGKGTIFRLYFPATEQAAAPAEAGQPARNEVPRGNGERILHVDDEEALVVVTKRRLEQLGYVVIGCTDSREALEIFRARPMEFDALITDVSMPRLPGAELVQAVQQIRPDIPVIMASGYLRSEDHAAADRLGIRELIAKPFDFGDLGRALHRILAGDLTTHKT